jgi:hypothetical protein
MTGQKYPGSSHILRTPYMSYSDDTGGIQQDTVATNTYFTFGIRIA